MQSKRFCFNPAVFKKSVFRFWPLWAVYFAGLALEFPLAMHESALSGAIPVRLWGQALEFASQANVILALIVAALAAMAVWSFLYSARSAHGMACLPLRRETVFVSCALAGLLPALAIHALIALITLLVGAGHGAGNVSAAAQLFAMLSMQYLLFYGFACFCAQLTGHILVLPAVYLVLNFVVYVVETLARALLSLMVFGMTDSAAALSFLSPCVYLFMHANLNYSYGADAQGTFRPVDFALESWGALAIYAAVGLAFLVLALLLFRRRRMETASDVVAVNVLKPVFRWCMALGCALCLSCLMYAIFSAEMNDYAGTGETLFLLAFLLLGAPIGWFAAEMLICKSFRVFRGRWRGLLICWALLLLGVGAAKVDLFGAERYVPAQEKIESAYVYCGGEIALVAQADNIAAVRTLHESILSHKAQYTAAGGRYDYSRSVRIFYHLSSGRTVQREYLLRTPQNDETSYGDLLLAEQVLNSPEATISRKQAEFELAQENITSAYVELRITAAEAAQLGGYESAEDYLLDLAGYSPADCQKMSETQYRIALNGAMWYYAQNFAALAGEDFMRSYGALLSDDDYAYPATQNIALGVEDLPAATAERVAGAESTPLRDALLLELALDADEALVSYTVSLTPREAYALYTECAMPDVREGKLGRITLTGLEDSTEFYAASIHIDFRRVETDERGVAHTAWYNFVTTPTVDSARTNAWLREKGIPLHLYAELQG